MSQKVDFMEVVLIFFLPAKGLAKTIYISRGDDHLQMKESEPHKDWTLDAGAVSLGSEIKFVLIEHALVWFWSNGD